MTDFQIRLIQETEKPLFIQQIQTAFQQPFEAEFGKSDKMILPVADIEESFANPKSQAYFAEMGNEIVGGVVVAIGLAMSVLFGSALWLLTVKGYGSSGHLYAIIVV